ncbi:iron complex transport system ATP-binding protein [Thalassobacillus cyri]|uniref:Iron complex transport system ATP-binding protein n=1 Tax=Thalassobacillus cyri TaxID=571932 RepID=A0A1H3VP63_9BACI|nr:adenosylcobinamide amidohydrolase [Thalassobacillus cyri]SDZ76471.1 iron complex transport system ATP-binding protein [Thalassobacillus cyri]
MIEVSGLTGGYQNEDILTDINLTINEGEFFALIGPNGSGKTTLLRLMTGALAPSGGIIEISGKPIQTYSPRKKAEIMAVLAQSSHVEFDFSVEEIVMLGRYPHQKGLIKHISRRDKEVVSEVMKQTEVYQYRNKPFKWLSGGEKQRVLLAKALAQEPKILFLDEPTNHLDVKHTVEMLQHLKAYQAKRQMTIIAILHDLNTAALFADRFGALHQGRLVKKGDLSVLKNETLLQKVYEVDIKHHSHPTLAKPQMLVAPEEMHHSNPHALEAEVDQNEQCIHIAFPRPLRVLSNAVVGEGLQWLCHFCNFYVPKNYDCSNPADDVRKWLEKAGIPLGDTLGMMTAVKLADKAIVNEVIMDTHIFTIVTAGVGNAMDITKEHPLAEAWQIGTINIMVFLDEHLTDGAFVNAVQSATEAKTKALVDMEVTDPATKSIATGTSTDSIAIAATQNGTPTPYAGSGTRVGKAIGQSVYRAVTEAIENYRTRVGK